MDFSKYGKPSQEWQDFDAAHPELHIDDEGKDDAERYGSPLALRAAINAQRIELVRAGLAASGLDAKVVITTHEVPTRDGAHLPLRHYRPAGQDPRARVPAYLFFHGGGMLFGTPEGEDLACAKTVDDVHLASGFVVLSLCYRHTPEHTFPTQPNDVWDAFEWIVAHADALAVDVPNLVVGGISAGSSLTAGLVYREVALARAERRPLRLKGQLLALPWLIHPAVYPYHLFASPEACSMVQAADAPILPEKRYNLFTALYKVPDPAVDIMNVALAADESLQGMPKTAMLVCGRDMLRDEAFLLASKLDRLGVPLKKHLFPGLPHAFRRHADLDSSRRWDAVTAECLAWILDDPALDKSAKVKAKDEGTGTGTGTWNIEVPEKYRQVDSHYFN